MSDDTPRSGGAAASGPEHDAWLREALRHAPDAGAAPPPSLRDAILAEARAAARTSAPRGAATASPTPTFVHQLLAFWSWLARPQVAAGFASVMAATLVGMLWWDRPIDETMLPGPSAPAVTPAPRSAPERAAAAVEPQPVAPKGKAENPPTAPADKATAPAADRLQESSPAMRDAAPVKSLPSREAAERTRDSERRSSAARGADLARQPEEAAKLAAKPAEAKTARKDDDRREQSLPPAESAAPAAGLAAPAAAGRLPSTQAPSPFPARPSGDADTPARNSVPAAPSPAPTQTRPEPFALAKKAEQGEKQGAATSSPPPPAAPVAPAAAPPPAPLGGALDNSSRDAAAGGLTAQTASPGSRQRALATPAQPMAALLDALASEAGRWTRRGAGAEAAAVDGATRAWLAQVQTATAARWQAASERDVRDGAAAAARTSPASALRLERDDRISATVRVEDGGIRFEPASGSAWFAPLPADVVARLRASLPPLAR